MNHAGSTFANSQKYMKGASLSCFHDLFQIAVCPLEINSKVKHQCCDEDVKLLGLVYNFLDGH